MIHADIYSAFQATQTADTHGLAAGYRQLANDWATGLHVFSTSIQRSVASSWEGQAADAFVSAINRYTTEAVEFETQLRALTARIDESAASVETTKYELPEPVEEKHPLHPDSWPVVGSNRDPVIEREQEEAQTIMANKYVTPFVNDYDTQIPVLSSPINPVQPFDIDEPTTGGQVGPGSTNPGDDSSSQQPGDDPSGDNQTDEDENPDITDTSDDDPESDPDTLTDDDESTPSSTDPDETEDTPDSPTTPAGTTPAGTTPSGTTGGPGGGGAPGSGLPGGGSPGNSPEAARSVPGSPGVVSPVSAAAAGSSASGAGRGMSMGGMPMGGGRGGQKEEDDAHTSGLLDQSGEYR